MKLKALLFSLTFHILTLKSCFAAEPVALNSRPISLSTDDNSTLESFFDFLIRQSEAGYVLYGKKPVCMNGFYEFDYFSGESERHFESACLQEGAAIWKKIAESRDSNIIIHTYNRSDVDVEGHIHVLVINKALFYETVQKNLILFQYVLGPRVTPTTLLEKLTDPKETFYGVLKGDKVLIGILLGFGAQNSLHVSRIENLQEAYLRSAEQFPLKSKFRASKNLLGPYGDVFLLHSQQNTKDYDFVPSFSYLSLEEEIADAILKIGISSEKLSRKQPMFIFGRLIHDEDTNKLVQELENTQDEIIELLSTENFTATVLKKIYPNAEIKVNQDSPLPKSFYPLENSETLMKIISKNCWNLIRVEEPAYIEGFLTGMQDAETGTENLSKENLVDYDRLKVIKTAKANVEEANLLLSNLRGNGEFTSLENGNVCYRISQEGNGETLANHQSITIHCRATSPSGEVLVDTWASRKPIHVDLNEAIPGFLAAIKEMREGETREIYIHPSLGYGLYTTLEKGIYLKADVHLIRIDDQDGDAVFSSVEPTDFSPIFDKLQQIDFEEISKIQGYFWGHSTWSHYKKEPSLVLSKIVDEIKLLQQATTPQAKNLLSEDTSKVEQRLLNQLHWHIYKKN